MRCRATSVFATGGAAGHADAVEFLQATLEEEEATDDAIAELAATIGRRPRSSPRMKRPY
jgi:ferritin-like metal-binding protein YciE